MSAPESESFRAGARAALADPALQGALERALTTSCEKRAERVAERPDWEALRDRAAAIREESVARLPELVAALTERLESAGCVVHHAEDGVAACERIVAIAREAGARRVVKSKSMATEEIGLNAALEAAGLHVRETDLGEFIVQLRGERPSHLTAPALHLSAGAIGRTFHEHLGTPETSDATTLTRQARAVLREDFLAADLGVSGANLAVAETGTLVVVTNEGNGRLVMGLPRTHVVVLGVDKVVPRLVDVPPLLTLLPASATGQRATSYVSLVHGPRRPGEADGPVAVHVVLLDNGRLALRDDPALAEVLRCIRCGACQNACPVYRHAGGHAWPGTYAGPFGSILEPALFGRGDDLPFASTLCGACAEVCPVRIDLPGLLVTLRQRTVEDRRAGRGERMAFALWRWAMGGRVRLWLASRLFRAAWRVAPGFVRRFQARLGWGAERALPPPAPRPFRRRWRALEREAQR